MYSCFMKEEEEKGERNEGGKRQRQFQSFKPGDWNLMALFLEVGSWRGRCYFGEESPVLS